MPFDPQARGARRPSPEGRLPPKPSPLASALLGLGKDDKGEDTDSESGSERSGARGIFARLRVN